MDAKEIKRICIEACDDTYEYYEDMQYTDDPKGLSKLRIVDYYVHGSFVNFLMGSKVVDTTNIVLSINGVDYRDEQLNIERFDEMSMILTMFPCEEVMQKLRDTKNKPKGSDKDSVELVTNMKYLIERTRKFYDDFGDMISLPAYPAVKFAVDDYDLKMDAKPSEQQIDAVDTVLNNRLSYVWGAPGTGKTQYVLAIAIISEIKKNRRVGIFAPTNNAVEQVLRGLLKMIKAIDPNGEIIDIDKDVLRLGAATEEFFEEYPNVCEVRNKDNALREREKKLEIMDEVIFEKEAERLLPDFDEIASLYSEMDRTSNPMNKMKIKKQIRVYFDEISRVMSGMPKFAHILVDANDYNYRLKAEQVSKLLYSREKPTVSIEYYSSMSLDEAYNIRKEIAGQIQKFKEGDGSATVGDSKIVAMTPYVFMARFCPNGVMAEGRIPLDVDHIFIDEAGYCNLIITMPFFTNGVPITLLGDHMQLPPVCEIDRELLTEAIKDDGRLRYSFLFDMSSRYAEMFFTNDISYLASAYRDCLDPLFTDTKQEDLTYSHRFGKNLAEVLDQMVYMNGITGVADSPLSVKVIDVRYFDKADRSNPGEAIAIKKYLEGREGGILDFIILTPYSKQLFTIEKTLPLEFKGSILTIHKSQGREWDTVIISVSDNRLPVRNVPYRFTSTSTLEGLQVINTAVSRAKKELIIVCDYEFWADKNEELIGRLVNTVPRSEVVRTM